MNEKSKEKRILERETYKLERTCDRLNYTIENLEDILSLIENKKTEDG